jgi:hypothetical protein
MRAGSVDPKHVHVPELHGAAIKDLACDSPEHFGSDDSHPAEPETEVVPSRAADAEQRGHDG